MFTHLILKVKRFSKISDGRISIHVRKGQNTYILAYTSYTMHTFMFSKKKKNSFKKSHLSL